MTRLSREELLVVKRVLEKAEIGDLVAIEALLQTVSLNKSNLVKAELGRVWFPDQFKENVQP